MSTGNVIQNAIARFWAKVEKRGADECWPWLWSTDKDGYGQAAFCQQNIRAHRLAFILTTANIPAGRFVLHSCDNPPCCNPAHLRIGTVKDNAEDAIARGRYARGELQGQALLTADEVRTIREQRSRGERFRALAEQFSVSIPTVQAVCARRNWKWVA